MQNHLSSEFLAAEHAEQLKKHGLDNFEALWAYEGEWFEPPNHKRGGWGGVNYLTLGDGSAHGYYLKRQSQYMRRTWRHPVQGEPTYAREFVMLRHLKNYPVNIPDLVYYAQHKQQSILMTAALTGYQPADQWFEQNATRSHRAFVLEALADAIRCLHDVGVEHRALFLKHCFIKPVGERYQVAMIDFEKSRRTWMIGVRWVFDLKRCLQRATVLTTSEKIFFLQKYLKTQTFNWWQRKVSHWLIHT